MKFHKPITIQEFVKLPCCPTAHSWEDILLLPLWRGRGVAVPAARNCLSSCALASPSAASAWQRGEVTGSVFPSVLQGGSKPGATGDSDSSCGLWTRSTCQLFIFSFSVPRRDWVGRNALKIASAYAMQPSNRRWYGSSC